MDRSNLNRGHPFKNVTLVMVYVYRLTVPLNFYDCFLRGLYNVGNKLFPNLEMVKDPVHVFLIESILHNLRGRLSMPSKCYLAIHF